MPALGTHLISLFRARVQDVENIGDSILLFTWQNRCLKVGLLDSCPII
jgi:hypothetical protein